MAKGLYNRNSFAAGLMARAGVAYQISLIQNRLKENGWAAPGLEQPLSQQFFRKR
jgi:hypothetical protein